MTRCVAAILFLSAGPGIAGEPTSVYTTNDPARDCWVVDRSPANEGSWVDLLCTGVAGYFYLVQQTGGREAMTYGHAAGPGMPTFGAVNHAGPTVEWRTAQIEGHAVPVAAIQRFHFADPGDGWATQILVVSKVGQPEDRSACVIGYVSANEGARRIADRAPSHNCARDAPEIEPRIAAHVPPH